MSTSIGSPSSHRTTERAVTGRLAWLARRLVRRWRVLLPLVILAAIVAALAGAGVEGQLSSGGYTPDAAPSARADRLLAERFHAGAPNLVLLTRAAGGVSSTSAAEAGTALTRRIGRSPGVVYAQSFWTSGDPALRSADGRTALIIVKLSGDDNQAAHTVRRLVPTVTGRQGPLQVQATGSAEVNDEVDRQSAVDLERAELLAAPLTALILLIAFGSLVAAGLPVLVGTVSVLGTLAVLRGLAELTPVSVFAMNITTALGFGLAVDYSLFIVTRYREELAAGRDVTEAIAATLASAGRTVLFSALTVALSLAALTVFPLHFLRSLAYAGIAVVVVAVVTSLVVLPPLLAVIGHRIDRADVFATFRRRLAHARGEEGLWKRLALIVMRRPALVAAAVTILLLALALPFAQARFALTDDRVLPRGSAAHTAADIVRDQFPRAATAPVVVVLPDLDSDIGSAALTDYAKRLSALPHTDRVDTATGTFAAGTRVAPPGLDAASFHGRGGTWLSVLSDADPNSKAAERHIRAVRALPSPGTALVGGDAATLVDTEHALAERIPWAMTIITVSMLLLLFLFSGSVVIPFQALLLNVLSLTASFGAMVYVFQDGHLKWLVGDFQNTGHLEITTPLLMFCIAFGLSMDYTVFLLSRIRERYQADGDNSQAVVFGLAHTGWLITAAALIVATVLAALATSHISLLKLLGIGLALAVLVDATLVRGLLVPAAMKLTGRVNWWAPGPLRRLHSRFGFREN